jgi:hypothetical protein
MGFLIRMAFWFSLVLLFIPFEVSDGDGRVDTVGPIQAFFAAKGAVDDIAGMCERKPDVCETGRSALQTIGLKARETARMAMPGSRTMLARSSVRRARSRTARS